MPHVPDASSDDGLFDPAQFQHLVDHGHENPMAISSNSESSSDSEFHVGGSDSNESEDESEDGTDALDAHVRESFQEDDNELDSESDSSEIGISGDTTPLAKYSRARPARPSVSSLSISSFSTPITQQSHVATPPCHFTRSQRKQDQALLSRNPPSSSGPHLDDRDRLIRKLRKELEHTHAQRDSAETHAVQAQRQCAVWKHRFNKKQEKARKETRRIYTRARVVSNDAGLEDAQQDHDKRAEKQQKEAAKIAQKAAKQKEDLVRRATQGSTRAFAGSLSLSKNKTELEDIADAVGIDISGTKAQLLERITSHFNDHPRFKEDARFCGLFDRARGRKRTAPDDENATTAPCPASRRRLSPSAHLGTVTNTYAPSHPAPHHFSVLSFSLASSSQVTIEDLPPN